MIAMALMCGPELIIADEPTTALDVTIQAQILRLLAELQAEFDMGLILITHDLGVVARVATRSQVMYAGKIVEKARCRTSSTPMHPYTQGLLRCIPSPARPSGARSARSPASCPRCGRSAGLHVPRPLPPFDRGCARPGTWSFTRSGRPRPCLPAPAGRALGRTGGRAMTAYAAAQTLTPDAAPARARHEPPPGAGTRDVSCVYQVPQGFMKGRKPCARSTACR
jgi:ABC-type glutathione transport system ATPase component